MGLWGCYRLGTIQIILVFSWMGMLMHQFEEYAFPGGFQSYPTWPDLGKWIILSGILSMHGRNFLSNVIFCYLSYIIPILFPNLIWMGASQVLAGVWQLPGHGIAMNVRLKSKYNPGLASTAFLQTPVAIYYIWYVVRYMPDKAGQLWWGFPVLLPLLLTFIVPILFMKDKNSKYPFDDRELYGYNKEHVIKLWEERKRKGCKGGKNNMVRKLNKWCGIDWVSLPA